MDALISIIEVLQINNILFFYIGFFVVVVILVSETLISPYYKVFLMRQNQTQGQIQKAMDMQKENDQLQEEYEKQLIQFNEQFQQRLQEKRNKILQHQQTLVDKTHLQARDLIQQSRETLQRERKVIEQQLKKQAPLLAQELSEKLIQ